jgi:uncharacterized DUF497 family protein
MEFGWTQAKRDKTLAEQKIDFAAVESSLAASYRASEKHGEPRRVEHREWTQRSRLVTLDASFPPPPSHRVAFDEL